MAHRTLRNERRPATITLVGIQVRRELVAWLADIFDEPVATRLRLALERDTRILGLEVDERETILRTLDDPPAGLEELRVVLLQEHV